MQLDTFFPYRLAKVAEAVSHSMSQIYGERFRMSRDEWRVLAAAGEADEMQTKEVAARTGLDKVSLSRAASKLEDRGYITRTESREDRRIKIIRLSPTGRATLSEVSRIVNERAAYLLEGLMEDERAALEGAIEKLENRAEVLTHPRNKGKCRPNCECTCSTRYAQALDLAMAH